GEVSQHIPHLIDSFKLVITQLWILSLLKSCRSWTRRRTQPRWTRQGSVQNLFKLQYQQFSDLDITVNGLEMDRTSRVTDTSYQFTQRLRCFYRHLIAQRL